MCKCRGGAGGYHGDHLEHKQWNVTIRCLPTPHRVALQPDSTQCGVGPVCVPIELLSTYCNLPQFLHAVIHLYKCYLHTQLTRESDKFLLCDFSFALLVTLLLTLTSSEIFRSCVNLRDMRMGVASRGSSASLKYILLVILYGWFDVDRGAWKAGL